MEFLPEGATPPPIRNVVSPEQERTYEIIRKELRKEAGRWAKLFSSVPASTRGKYQKALGLSFEVVARFSGFDNRGKRQYDIYARRMPLTAQTTGGK